MSAKSKVLDSGAGKAGRLDGHGFARLRSSLGKSQRELAELLGLSLKAVESYEQGWRQVPFHVERMMYFLSLKLSSDGGRDGKPCWDAKGCPEAKRSACVAYVSDEGRFCWFFTGRLCADAGPGLEGCRGCEVFASMLQRIEEGGTAGCR
jgi:hypothetical protein